jgi:hypothetical protein
MMSREGVKPAIPVLHAVQDRVGRTVTSLKQEERLRLNSVKSVLNGISRLQNIFPLKSGFRLIKVYYDSHGT